MDCESLTPTQGATQQSVDCESLTPTQGPTQRSMDCESLTPTQGAMQQSVDCESLTPTQGATQRSVDCQSLTSTQGATQQSVDCQSLTPTQGAMQQRVDCEYLTPTQGAREALWAKLKVGHRFKSWLPGQRSCALCRDVEVVSHPLFNCTFLLLAHDTISKCLETPMHRIARDHEKTRQPLRGCCCGLPDRRVGMCEAVSSYRIGLSMYRIL